jgi:hypothetical protein
VEATSTTQPETRVGRGPGALEPPVVGGGVRRARYAHCVCSCDGSQTATVTPILDYEPLCRPLAGGRSDITPSPRESLSRPQTAARGGRVFVSSHPYPPSGTIPERRTFRLSSLSELMRLRRSREPRMAESCLSTAWQPYQFSRALLIISSLSTSKYLSVVSTSLWPRTFETR